MEFKAPSGAKVKINPADWKSAVELKSACAKEAIKSGVNIDFGSINSDTDITDLVKLFLFLDSSSPVYDALFSCLKRCTHNGQSITEDLFEDMTNRGDYYDIAMSCFKVNFTPFSSGLRSALSQLFGTLMPQKSEDQK